MVFAHHQSNGRGRFGRTWESARGDSLTMSLIFWGELNHPQPWLLGMSVALTAAQTLGCQVQWPNDLVLNSKKLGGVLTELIEGVPVVGIGINLNQSDFPSVIADIATSLYRETHATSEPLTVAQAIVNSIQSIKTPKSWDDLKASWTLRDATPGKVFRAPNGVLVTAKSIGPNGELLAVNENDVVTLLAADAWFGSNTP